jgi:hypothetical protein
MATKLAVYFKVVNLGEVISVRPRVELALHVGRSWLAVRLCCIWIAARLSVCPATRRGGSDVQDKP